MAQEISKALSIDRERAMEIADQPQGPTLPAINRKWNLYGAGLDNLGQRGRPETEPLRSPGADEILVRHDACGICYSDIKIVALGGDHPRLVGRDLTSDPVVIGHEVALTVVSVGEHYAGRFHPGERYIVQADIFYRGQGMSYGYRLPGGMSQYGFVGREVIEGDEGCYLLPISDATGAIAGALVEPWACVDAAYRPAARPARPEDATVTVSGHPAPEAVEKAIADLSKRALVYVDVNAPLSRPVAVDIGRIHYDGHLYVGPRPNERRDLRAGGTVWFLGAAGPMGQMHVQRALQLPDPPRRIVATDRSAERLAAMHERFAGMAGDSGVTLDLIDVHDGEPDYAAFAPDGFDDIVVLVPSAVAVEQAFPHLADGGVLNIFAGIQRGVTARLPIWEIATRNVRIVGTTGSSLADMAHTRDRMEAGLLDTTASLAAVGGLDALKDGLEAVRDGRFPGKTVILPHVADLPLTALADLKNVRPAAYQKLRDGRYWTSEAEAELMRPTAPAGRNE